MSKKTTGLSRRKLLRQGVGLAVATAGAPLIKFGSCSKRQKIFRSRD